jgi:hypothetical protein
MDHSDTSINFRLTSWFDHELTAYQIGIDRRLLSSAIKTSEDTQQSELDPQCRCLKAIPYVSFAELQPRLSHEPLVHDDYE